MAFILWFIVFVLASIAIVADWNPLLTAFLCGLAGGLLGAAIGAARAKKRNKAQ